LTGAWLTQWMHTTASLKLIPRMGKPHENYCANCKCDVDRNINAAMNILEVFLFLQSL
jgi:transposase